MVLHFLLPSNRVAGNLAVFQVGGVNKARIDATGKGFFNGGTQNSGADVAEAFDISGNRKDYEAGDVLVISQICRVEKLKNFHPLIQC